MWKQVWRKWTIDKPAVFGDWLWEMVVVEPAAFLRPVDFETYDSVHPCGHSSGGLRPQHPAPPGIDLIGDMLAYIDVFSIILLLSLLGRAATIVYVIRQAAEHLLELVRQARIRLHRPDSRHRRAGGAKKPRRLIVRTKKDDDHAPIYGVAWA